MKTRKTKKKTKKPQNVLVFLDFPVFFVFLRDLTLV